MTLPPVLKALIMQLCALAGVSIFIKASGIILPAVFTAASIGLLAASLSYIAGLQRWWIPIQFFFVPALLGMLLLDLSPWIYLIGFIALAAVYWNTYRTQVPLYLSSQQAWQAIETLLPVPSFSFLDAGAGVGGVLEYLSRKCPGGKFVGVETAPLPFFVAWLRLRGRTNCVMLHRDLWKTDFKDFDVVYAYLSPVPMQRLWEKACREMRPGCLLVSNTFEIPDQLPDRVIQLEDIHRSRLFLWRIPIYSGE